MLEKKYAERWTSACETEKLARIHCEEAGYRMGPPR
jgi:hypothetical protein